MIYSTIDSVSIWIRNSIWAETLRQIPLHSTPCKLVMTNYTETIRENYGKQINHSITIYHIFWVYNIIHNIIPENFSQILADQIKWICYKIQIIFHSLTGPYRVFVFGFFFLNQVILFIQRWFPPYPTRWSKSSLNGL